MMSKASKMSSIFRTDQADDRPDGRMSSPSATRNAEPILATLRTELDGLTGLALEIGSGTGQHITEWAAAFPDMHWQPSDPFDVHLDSVRAWVAAAGCTNVRAPIWLDAAEDWPNLGKLSLAIAVNVIQITPWVVTEGIFRGASKALQPGGKLVFYGPFREGGAHTGEGNAKFDATLRAQDPSWGIRDIDDLSALGEQHALARPAIHVMPANNRMLVFDRVAP